MGSWNGTCQMSHLPIRAGDKIVLIPTYSKYGTKPIGLPIIGKYNDYGSIENIDNMEVANVFWRHMKAGIQSSDIKCNSKDLGDIYKVLDSVERGNVKYGGEGVGLVMFHKAVFDSVVKEIGDRYAYKEVINNYRAEWCLKIENALAEVNELNKDTSNPMLKYKIDTISMGLTRVLRDAFFYDDNFVINEYYKDSSLVEPLADLMLISTAFNLARYSWSDMDTGSQSEERMVQNAVSSAASKVSERYLESLEVDDDEEVSLCETLWSPIRG